MTALLERAIAAHGGREAWSGGAGFAVELRVGGAAWPLRLRRAPGLLRARVSTQAPEAEFLDFPTAGLRGMFEPGLVRIEDAFAHRVAERHDPRAAFRTLRHKLRWDDCDFLYFAGYALWNYLAFPFMLERPGVAVADRADRALAVRFPPDFPTHSPEQVFHLDDRNRLVRHDYTALVFGRWARAAHLCAEHRALGGLCVPTRRRVYPRLPGGRVAPAPVIVSLDVLSVRPLA